MPQRRPKPDAVSLEQKRQQDPLPTLAKNLNGGVLDRQPEVSHHHVGVLPDRRGIADLPPTEPPVEVLTQQEEAAMEAVQEGCAIPEEEVFAPPVRVSFSGEGPAEPCEEPP